MAKKVPGVSKLLTQNKGKAIKLDTLLKDVSLTSAEKKAIRSDVRKKYQNIPKQQQDQIIADRTGAALKKANVDINNQNSVIAKKDFNKQMKNAPRKLTPATQQQGSGNNWVYTAAKAGVGGGLVLGLANSKGKQSNGQLYNQF